MKMFRKEEGFTLVELMVVVLIIGILVAIAVPIFNAARANAQQRSCQANMRTVNGAAQTYAAEAQSLPTALGDLVPDYVKATPTCPTGGTYTYDVPSGTLTCSLSGGTPPHALP